MNEIVWKMDWRRRYWQQRGRLGICTNIPDIVATMCMERSRWILELLFLDDFGLLKKRKFPQKAVLLVLWTFKGVPYRLESFFPKGSYRMSAAPLRVIEQPSLCNCFEEMVSQAEIKFL